MSIEGNPANTEREANGTTAERQFDSLLRLTLDDADQRTQVVREDGKVYTYAYDAIGQLTNASATLPDGPLWPGYQFSYAYDATGNPVEQNKNGLVYSNSFNNLNQNAETRFAGGLAALGTYSSPLAATVAVNNVQAQLHDGDWAATGISFVQGTNALARTIQDLAGRSSSATSTVVVADRTYAYDANGNMTTNGVFAYVWDCENRLTEVWKNGALVQSNRYDALWRRREKIEYAPDGTATTNRYIYKDWLEVSSHVVHNSAEDIDSDGDGIPDGDEWAGISNPFREPTNPWNADSDGDGLSDYDECFVHLTNPNAWATDGDLYPFMAPGTPASSWPGSDSYEISHNWNPKVRDQNGNGIPDSWEMALGLDTLLSGTDSDADGIDDLTELRQNSNPQDPADFEDKPFALVFESSAPGWVNGAPDNDVGFGGWVQLHVTGASEGDCIIVAVSEGNVPEEFSIRWKGADRSETTWNPSRTSALTVAWLSGDATLVVKDNAMHSDFTGSLGGEYTFQFYRGNLDAKRIAHNADAGFLPNALEMAPGAFLPVNDDDDDYDEQHAPDKDEAGRVEGETDLLPIVLRAASPASAGGTYTLNIPAHVRVWQNADRIGSVTPATEFSASVDTTLYVEAVAKGSGPLKLNWQNTLFNVVAVDNVRVPAFEWAGPLNVPDYSIHRYTASGAQAGSRWIAPVGGTIHEGADTSEIRIFWGPGPIVGKAVYQATSDYIWDLEVNVVQILIASPEHTFVAGDPYFAGAKIIGTSRVAFVTSYRDPVPGLWWQADVSLCGPSDNRGVSRMKVGFIQNLIGYLNRGHYQNQESILIADIEAMTPLLDCAEGMAPWIYDDDSDSIFFDASETNLEKRIFTWDDPGDGCPVAFSQTLNPGNDDDLLTRMEFRDDFQLNVCVQTRDTQNDADKVYTRRASANWSFVGSGNVTNYNPLGMTTNEFHVLAPEAWTVIQDGSMPLSIDGKRFPEALEDIQFIESLPEGEEE